MYLQYMKIKGIKWMVSWYLFAISNTRQSFMSRMMNNRKGSESCFSHLAIYEFANDIWIELIYIWPLMNLIHGWNYVVFILNIGVPACSMPMALTVFIIHHHSNIYHRRSLVSSMTVPWSVGPAFWWPGNTLVSREGLGLWSNSGAL